MSSATHEDQPATAATAVTPPADGKDKVTAIATVAEHDTESGSSSAAPEKPEGHMRPYTDAAANASQRKVSWKEWSVWELVALMASATMLALMSVFLWKYNGGPAPEWSYQFKDSDPMWVKANRITFNAILSIFSKAAALGLGFAMTRAMAKLTWIWFMGEDDKKLADLGVFHKAAQKDPAGAAQLLWMLRGRHLATVGALTVIGVSLGFDFFIQQLVTLPTGYWSDGTPKQIQPNDPTVLKFNKQFSMNQSIPLPDSLQIARIANTTNFTYSNVGEPPYYTVGLDMKAAIWAGLFSEDGFGGWAVPQYYCATGNCTWGGYPSLGVCSKCADISHMLNKTCTPSPSDLNNQTGCDIKLPNGFTLGGTAGSRNHLLAASTDYPPLVYGNYTDPLVVVQTISSYDTLFVSSDTPVTSWECVLTPCVNVYSYSEVYSSPQDSQSGYNAVPYNELVSYTQDNYTFSTSASPWNGPTIEHWLHSDQTLTTYQFSQPAYLALKNYLLALFNGFVTTDGKAMSYTSDNKTRPVQVNTADVMQALATDLNYCYDVFQNPIYDPAVCSIQNAALAMTVVVRDNYFNYSDFSTYFRVGQTYSPKPTVAVAWPWIIPVCTFWALGLVLTLGTMWKASRRNMSTLPLDPLTFIFMNVEREGPEEEWWRSDEMQHDVAERTQVRLRVRDHRVSFVPGARAQTT